MSDDTVKYLLPESEIPTDDPGGGAGDVERLHEGGAPEFARRHVATGHSQDELCALSTPPRKTGEQLGFRVSTRRQHPWTSRPGAFVLSHSGVGRDEPEDWLGILSP